MEINPRDIGFVSGDIKEEYSHHSSLTDSDSDSVSDYKIPNGGVITQPNDIKPIGTSTYHIQKWERLRKYYNDQYLDLFNDAYRDDTPTADPHDLLDSQIGAIKWTSDEKKLIFAALAKHGRHDLSRLKRSVVTKSPIEIAAYLSAVQTAYADRQRFMRSTKNISIVEIPAAIEIGVECEAALEKAADALIAYQQQYDIAAGQKEMGPFWLIDREVASKLDEIYENAATVPASSLEANGDSANVDRHVIEDNQSSIKHLFKLSTMLDLSEQIFMNHDDQSSLGSWTKIAEPGQKPAITEESVQTLLGLLTHHLRQILKVSIQVADARISSMSNGGYSASHKLGQADVAAALDILNLSRDSWDYWAKLARRNNFQVITGSHSKGESRSQAISYDQAEAWLTVRRGRGRRRSMSIGSETSSLVSDLTTDTEPVSDYDTDRDDYADMDELNQESDSVDSEIPHTSNEREASIELGSFAVAVPDKTSSKAHTSHEDRRSHLEEASHDYAENIDNITKINEEKKIWQILRKRPRVDIYDDDDDDDDDDDENEVDQKQILRTRPKTLRKLQKELKSWSCEYMAEWERYHNMIGTSDVAAQYADDVDAVPFENNEDG